MIPTDAVRDSAHLDEPLSEPTRGVVESLSRLDGTLLVLGAAGKMGPTPARMAKRAAAHLRIVAVSRFTNPASRETFERHGIETLTADLLDPGQAEEIDRVYAAYPHLNDDACVAKNRDAWLNG